ncbi:MAG: cytochrome c [Acidimicrobiales bacterium]|nr:cytochrome c [Acidimicrobiales bacterium]
MTEIPEHLLRRSRDRREALGLPTTEGGESPAPASAAPAAPAPVAATAAPPAAPAAAAAVPAEPAAPTPLPPYVQAANRRVRIPFWAIPVLVLLPVWAFLYAATLDSEPPAAQGPLGLGETLYTANCVACHLGNGAGDAEGGVGRQLSDGQVLLTFPDALEQETYIKAGSSPVGEPYGAADRPGGQHVARGGMPAFEGVLTDEEIVAVTCYERITLSGAEPTPECTGEVAAGG